MKRRTNLINNAIYLLLTMGALFGVLMICNNRYSEDIFPVLLKFIVGAIIAGFLNTCAHELGHFIAGKRNGFTLSSISIWFFKWSKVGKKIRFDFTMIGEEAGYTEMIPTTTDNLKVNLKKMTRGGVFASFVMMLIGVPPLFITGLPSWIYCVWSSFLPIGAYFFFGTALPMSNVGVLNDGAVLYALKKEWDTIKVLLALLAIQVEMYNGKTPAEVDEKLYFELPQLPEDDPNFAMLLDARYNYYLDKGDYDNAKKCCDRLISVIDYMPKNFYYIAKTNELYNACTFDYNEETADDIMYEIEKYLNGVNNTNTVRAKLAYLINVKKEKECLDIFYKKGIKEADRCQIKGLGLFEKKLFDELKEKVEN